MSLCRSLWTHRAVCHYNSWPCGLEALGPRLQWSIQGSDVHAGQGKPRQRQPSPGAVVLEADVQVEVSGVKKHQSSFTHRTVFGFNLETENRQQSCQQHVFMKTLEQLYCFMKHFKTYMIYYLNFIICNLIIKSRVVLIILYITYCTGFFFSDNRKAALIFQRFWLQIWLHWQYSHKQNVLCVMTAAQWHSG